MSIRQRAILATLALLAVGTHAYACLWLHGTTIEGHYKRVNKFDPAKLLEQCLSENPAKETSFFRKHDYQPDDPVSRLNDEAVQVLLKGDAAKAVTMLKDVEAKHPGQYFTAANLGTAYELSGDDVQALEWIKEGIRRNPKSHMETEWLHAAILEAKIRLKEDPDWLNSHTITGVDFGQFKNTGYALSTLQGSLSAEEVRESLHSQLGVRMLFVKPKDMIVAHLLKELARAEAQIGILQTAVAHTELAERYGLDPGVLASERASWKEIIRKNPPITENERKQKRIIHFSLLMGGMFLVLVLFMKVRKDRRQRSAAA